MLIKTLVVGPFQCNCSILVCETTREAIVIDAGDEWERIKKILTDMNVTLKYSVHTHAHLDHIGAVGSLKTAHPSTKIALHKDDNDLYQQLPMQGRLFGLSYAVPPSVDHFMEHEEVLKFGEHNFSVLHTPGHSPGGVCLRFKEGVLGDKPFLFSGDTLFRESIGRTDLWGGDFQLLSRSIKERLFTLTEETQVMPGHGPATTIYHEKKENPFL